MTSRIGRPPHPDVLTPAEWRVLEQLRAGHPNAEIAVRLGISVNTVKYHVSNMLAKLEVPDRHALAEWDGQPKRRFGFLPTFPSIGPLALGLSLGRGAAILGGLAAATVVAAVALASSPSTAPEARTDLLLWVFSGGPQPLQIVGLDPLTGAPLSNAEPLNMHDQVGNPLTADGSLFWTTPSPWLEPAQRDSTTITVQDGGRLGLAESGHSANFDGVIRRWSLPDTDAFSYIAVVGPPADATDEVTYAARITVDEGPDEIWALDLNSDRGRLVAVRADVSDLLRTADGRLFIVERAEQPPTPPSVDPVSADAVTAAEFGPEFTDTVDEYLATARDHIVELDPDDGGELARIELPGPIARTFFSPDDTLLYALTAEDGALTVIDLDTMQAEQRSLPADGPWPGVEGLGPFVSTVLSPDGNRLYLTGTDLAPECDRELAPDAWCRERATGIRVIDLPSNSVVYEDPRPNQSALSADGQRMLTGVLSFAFSSVEDAELKVIDTATFDALAQLNDPDRLRAFAFSSDGDRVYAVANGDHSVTTDCYSQCTTVLVLGTSRLEVIATHLYEQPIVRLMTVPE